MVFSQNITPTWVDIRWGRDRACRLDVLQHPVRLPEGNPVVVVRHDGGGMTRDKRQVWVAGGAFNVFANWLNQNTAVPFDFWSVGTPQSHYNSPIAAAHLATTFDDKLTRPVVFPESVYWLKNFFQWANRFAKGLELVPETGVDLGHRGGDYIGAGKEFGALLQAVACFSGPTPPASNGQLIPGGRWGPYGTSSSIRGLVLHDLIVDVRNLAGAEQIYWAAVRGLFGTYEVLLEWSRIPSWERAAASPLAYVQSGQTRNIVPQYLVQSSVGNHLKPYGDPLTGAGADVRDSDQVTSYVSALSAVVPAPSFGFELIADGDWETEVNGAAISNRAFTFMRAAVGR